MSELTLTPPPVDRVIRRRTRRDPEPRFVVDRSRQLDGMRGCPHEQVPKDHLARSVLREVAKLDVSAVEARYSSLGRRGFSPRSLLSLWVYASLIGVHHASKLAKLLETDAACRLLTGGHSVSRAKLSEFRAQNGALFAAAIEQTVKLAVEAGLVPVDELATDSMRLRAHASTKAVRTVVRSKKRLTELETLDATKLDECARAEHEAKTHKHRSALAECEKRGRTNVVLTNPSASLMKFPSGAGLPGHRVSVTAAGVRARIVVAVLIDADTNDYGKLDDMLRRTRDALTRAGVEPTAQLQLAADAGYCSGDDLVAAEAARGASIDVLIDGTERPEPQASTAYFGRDRFDVRPDGTVVCPAGKRMLGPCTGDGSRHFFRGDGCGSCPLKAQCTSAKHRSFTIDPRFERGRTAMQDRMARPGARQRYGQRIATVEPVFSHIEDTMGFRRASSRHAPSVIAEVLLKILAHNLQRIATARRLRLVFIRLDEFLETL
jgi:transposase